MVDVNFTLAGQIRCLTARKKVAQNSNVLCQCKCSVNDMIRIYFVLLIFLLECIRVPALMVVPTILIH